MTKNEDEFLADVVGQFLAKVIGNDADWLLIYRLAGDGKNHVVSTTPPHEFVELMEEMVNAIRTGRSYGHRTHDIKLDRKSS
jgi:dihydrodipicolinate synthase/N-acetylneuraminate lyase